MNYKARYLKTHLYSNELMKSGGRSKKSIKPWILAAWLLSTTLGETPAMADNPTVNRRQPVSTSRAGDETKDVSENFPYKLVEGTECAGGKCGMISGTEQYHSDVTCKNCYPESKMKDEHPLRASQEDETEAAPSGTGSAGGGTPGGSGPDDGLSFEEVSLQDAKDLIRTAERIKNPGLKARKALVPSEDTVDGPEDEVDGPGTRATIPEAMSANKGKPVSQPHALGKAVKHQPVLPPRPRDVPHGGGAYAPNGVRPTPEELVQAKNNLKKTDPFPSARVNLMDQVVPTNLTLPLEPSKTIPPAVDRAVTPAHPQPETEDTQNNHSRIPSILSAGSSTELAIRGVSELSDQESDVRPSLSGGEVHSLTLSQDLRTMIKNAHPDKGGTGVVKFQGRQLTIGKLKRYRVS